MSEIEKLRSELAAALKAKEELAALVGKAIVWTTIDPLQGEKPAERADHALLDAVWSLVQDRAAALKAKEEAEREWADTCLDWNEAISKAERERDEARARAEALESAFAVERVNTGNERANLYRRAEAAEARAEGLRAENERLRGALWVVAQAWYGVPQGDALAPALALASSTQTKGEQP